jgi:hypothetical protein
MVKLRTFLMMLSAAMVDGSNGAEVEEEEVVELKKLSEVCELGE